MVEVLLPLNSQSNNSALFMKSSQLHRKVKKGGWKHVRTKGSHDIYEKDGRTYPVPFHGAKEVGKGLENKIVKEMGLR